MHKHDGNTSIGLAVIQRDLMCPIALSDWRGAKTLMTFQLLSYRVLPVNSEC